MKKGCWTPIEQKKEMGSAKSIATTANLLFGLRSTDIGNQFLDAMVEQAGMDEDLCKGGTWFILVSMLPFAVELCLKALKAQGGEEFFRTHNLKLLWDDLQPEERREIRQRVEDPAWRKEEREQRDAFGITGQPRKVDEVIEVHQNDFEEWRYVTDGEKNLPEEKKGLIVEEALMDLFRIVFACVEYHNERDGHPRLTDDYRSLTAARVLL